jgi:hypothetical protein
MEAAATHLAFHGAANFADSVPGASGGERLPEGALGATGELASSCCFWRDLDGDGGIGVVAVLFGGEIKFDEIAGLKDTTTRNAVNDLIIETDADVSGKSIDDRWRRTRTVFGKNLRTDQREFGTGDAGTDGSDHSSQGFGNDAAADAEFLELVGSRN